MSPFLSKAFTWENRLEISNLDPKPSISLGYSRNKSRKLSLQNYLTQPTHTELDWQQSLRLAIRNPAHILEYVGVRPQDVATIEELSFPAFATREYLDRVVKKDQFDPLLLQVLPISKEQDSKVDSIRQWKLDPVGDHESELLPGLLHKYQGRMLMIATGACAVHCRYCFRQHYPYSDVPKSIEGWKPAIERIASDTSIQEIILSGGDPLMLVDEKLAWLVEQFDDIGHLKRLRIHTRLPVMIPNRVGESMLRWLSSTRLSTWMVLHINHANEVDREVVGALERLKMARCQLLNQSVLLKGINDSVEALVALSERLLDVGVVPYYLHQLDPVQGGAHFEVPIDIGRSLVAEMRRRLPGYAIPRYVSEIAGEAHKTLLM